MRVIFKRTAQIERTAIKHFVQIDIGTLGAKDNSSRIDCAYCCFDIGKFLRADKIGLVQKDNIGKSNLVFCFTTVFQLQRQMFCVDECHNSIKLRFCPDIIIHKKCLCNRNRIGKTGCFDNDTVKPARTAHQTINNTDQVAAHCAADTTIIHLVNFFVGFDNQIIVNTDLAEFIDNDSIMLAMIFCQNPVKKRGFTSPQITGQNSYRNFTGCFFSLAHSMTFQMTGIFTVVDIGFLNTDFYLLNRCFLGKIIDVKRKHIFE